MNNLWRKSFMAGILSVSLTAGAVTPAFASAAPDGKTDAASLAGGMGISQNWESWKTEWEAVKNDWTQVSLTPGSDFSQLIRLVIVWELSVVGIPIGMAARITEILCWKIARSVSI